MSTQGERLARIETLLETVNEKIAKMSGDLAAVRGDLDTERVKLKSLQDKGLGLLVGVGLAGGGIGAAVTHLFDKLR